MSVPAERLARWVDNFAARHGASSLVVAEGAVRGAATDGSWFEARLPFGASYDGEATAAGLAEAARAPDDWGLLLVRKGGFAVARLSAARVVDSKVGQRHVQGRTKAGGQSQQRFARRRDNQARAAYDAAADHAARILAPSAPGVRLPVVVGGDRVAAQAVLADPRLGHVRTAEPWLPVPDPRRRVLQESVREALAIRVEVVNADPGGSE